MPDSKMNESRSKADSAHLSEKATRKNEKGKSQNETSTGWGPDQNAHARLDNEGITGSSRADHKKVKLDSDGVVKGKLDDERAVLDKEGVSGAKKAGSDVSGRQKQIERSEEQIADGQRGLFGSITERIRKLPLAITATVLCVSILLCSAAWIGFRFILKRQSTMGPVSGEDVAHKSQDQLHNVKSAESQEMTIPLEPFIVAVRHDNKAAFMRLTVLLQTRRCYEKHVIGEVKAIRSVIYNRFSGSQPNDINDNNERERIKTKLLEEINDILKDHIIEDLDFTDVLIA